VKTEGSLSASLLLRRCKHSVVVSHAMRNATNAATSPGPDDIEESLRSPVLLSDPLLSPPPVPMTTSATTTTEMHSATLDDSEVHPPLWSSFIATTQFGWRNFKVPFLFVLINIFAISSLLSENASYYPTEIREDTTTTPSNNTLDPAFVQMRHNSTLLGILFLCNTAVLFRGTLSIEQQVDSMRRRQRQRRQQESSSSNENDNADTNNASTLDSSSEEDDDLTHVHARISQTIDLFLCRGRASQLPDVSFLVNMLFLMTAWSLVGTAVSFSVSAFLYSSQASSVCTTYQAPTDLDAVKGVPVSLHQWVLGHTNGEDETQIFGSSYVHLKHTGMTYFAGTNRTRWEEKDNNNNKKMMMTWGNNNNNNDDEDYSWNIYRRGALGKELFSAGPDGALMSYPEIRNPHYFTKLAEVVGGGSKEPSQKSEVFCCIYISKAITDKKKSWRWMMWGGWPSVLCMGGGEWTDEDDKQKKELRTIGLSIDVREGRFLEDYALRGYEGTLWIRAQWLLTRVGGGRLVELYKLDPHNMNLTVVPSTCPEGAGGDYGATPCLDWINAVQCIVGVPLLLLMAYWQLRFRDIPAGMASLCLGPLAVMMRYLNAEWTAAFGVLASVSATISLFHELPPWMSRDMVHWGMYTSLAVLVVTLNNNDGEQYSILLLCVIIGVVLNHPVLQIMGWLFGVITLFFSLLDWDVTGILVALVVSCGFLRLGVSLDKHRPYLMYYSRRLTRILTLMARNSFSTGQGRGGTVSHHPHSSDAAVPFLNTRDD
jgi:hypothetical protein